MVRLDCVLIHLHIPKNGGTTLSRMVKSRLIRWPPTRWRRPFTILGCPHVPIAERRIAHIRSLAPGIRKRIVFFEAHRGYGMHEPLGVNMKEAVYFTMLRDPIKRAISVHDQLVRDRMIQRNSGYRGLLEGNRADSNATPWVWWIDNAQVRYLAAEHGGILDLPADQITEEHLECAKHRIERDIAVTGLLERFDESVLLLLEAIGWSRAHYVRSNSGGAEKTMPTDAERALLEEYNQLDRRLYAHAVSLFEERLDALGDVESRLRNFLARNERYARLVRPVYKRIPKLRRLLMKNRGSVGRSDKDRP